MLQKDFDREAVKLVSLLTWGSGKRANVKISRALVEELDRFDLSRVGKRIAEHRL